MKTDNLFWQELNQLIQNNQIVIDRPKGKAHPRYAEAIYPLDYGYIENTTSGDGDGIDVWIGGDTTKTLTGILCTFDTFKRDAEIKLLIGCTDKDIESIQQFHKDMHKLFISNPMKRL